MTPAVVFLLAAAAAAADPPGPPPIVLLATAGPDDTLTATVYVPVPVTRTILGELKTADGKSVPVPQTVTEYVTEARPQALPLAGATLTDPAGKPLTPARVGELLKDEGVVVVSYGTAVGPRYRKAFRGGVVFVEFPLPKRPVPVEHPKDLPPGERPG